MIDLPTLSGVSAFLSYRLNGLWSCVCVCLRLICNTRWVGLKLLLIDGRIWIGETAYCLTEVKDSSKNRRHGESRHPIVFFLLSSLFRTTKTINFSSTSKQHHSSPLLPPSSSSSSSTNTRTGDGKGMAAASLAAARAAPALCVVDAIS